VVVGGGPAGCAAGVFTARYGLDTVIFDRGNAALRRCAYLANYLGFPAGIDVDTFHDLMHAHADESGCDRHAEQVVSVSRDSADGLVVETQEGRRVTTRYVVAAAWYDGSYLRPLDDGDDDDDDDDDDDEEMFEAHEHHGDVEERFDPDYPDDDGRTPVEGLYVASPAGARSAQAVVAAGTGAHVARCLVADHRREQGYSGGVAPHYDWLRPESEFTGEWAERDRWREWYDNESDGPVDETRRERYVDRAFDTQLSEAEIAERTDRGIRRLVEVIGPERILESIDDATVTEYVRTRQQPDNE
jgi:hypothetical protein